jgi:hypothetical protein
MTAQVFPGNQVSISTLAERAPLDTLDGTELFIAVQRNTLRAGPVSLLFRMGTGATADRPVGLTSADIGLKFYDTTLLIPIWWDGSLWRNAAGGPA